MRFISAATLSAVFVLVANLLAFGQQPERNRIAQPIDESRVVTLRGNVPPFAVPQFDRGAVPASSPSRRMLLLLSRSPEQEQSLLKLLEEQQTPGSGNYQKWLTPAQFGQLFGVSDADVQTVANWLADHGFQVEHPGAGRNVIEFSGNVRQVQQAFHTEIHKYAVNGKEYWANTSDPQIPAALAPVIDGVVSLNNFPRKPLSRQIGLFSRDRSGVVTPEYTVSSGSGTYYALGPADFATIYNTSPLLQSGINGTGQTIAILGRTNIHLQDITDFRNLFALGAGNTSVVIDGPDPGMVTGDESESLLDLEWANAVAPGASVILVSAEDTETTSGLDLAALHAIENNLAGVISVSYGGCEAHLGSAGNQFIQSLWQQAAAQGITVMVSSGDSGSAGCDNQNVKYVATSGLGVNALASTAYNVAVGGTDFDDAGTQSLYWNSTNDSTTRASAKSYIPEATWNETCAASATASNLNVCPTLPATGTPPDSLNLWAGSGGASSCTVSTSSVGTISCQSGTPKPSWQTGPGVPSDGVRDLPDVSLFSAAGSNSNSFYVVCQADGLPAGYPSCQPSNSGIYFFGAGGTSAAAPSFAGIVALAEQKTGTRLGNLNYLLYSLAAQAGASCASAGSPGSSCVFNDVVKGNIAVPCQAGSPNCSQASGTATGVIVDASQSPAYSAASGYDLATGLGSVNAANLVTAIAKGVSSFTPTSTALTLNGTNAALTAQHGDSINVGISVTPSASAGSVALLGNSGGIASNTLTSGTANWSSKLFPGGSYSVKAHYAGDGIHGASDSNGISVTINAEPSQSLVNLVTFDSKGLLQTFTGNSVNYGSPYLLRVDVTDAAGTVSSTQGVNSKCSTGTASCPTGTLTIAANGAALDGGSFRLNSKGFSEDQAIQLAAGTYTVTAAYPGDASYNASTGTASMTVSKGATTTTEGISLVSSYEYGTPAQINANVATTSWGAAPTATITFSDNGTPAGASVFTILQTTSKDTQSGNVGLAYSGYYIAPAPGTHSLSAQYPGDSNYLGSSSPAVSITVAKATTSGGVSAVPAASTPSLPVKLTAQISSGSVTALPTGTVTFYDNGTPLSETVTYGGHPGAGITYSAVLTASLTHTFSQTGVHAITAAYSGDANYTALSTAATTLNVSDKLPSAVYGLFLLSAPLGVPVNISATAEGTTFGGPALTGTIAFTDNGVPMPGTVSYQYTGGLVTAVLGVTYNSLGTHTIVAQYSGDSIYGPSQAQTSFSVVAPFSLSSTSGNALTIGKSGGSGTMNLAVFPASSMTAVTVNLSCTPSSSKTTCSVSPASVTLGQGTASNATVTYAVPALGATLLPARRIWPWSVASGVVVGGMFMLFVPGWPRRRGVMLLMIVIGMAATMIACGGGGSAATGGGSGGPTSQTYTFTVTGSLATAPSVTTSLTFTVTEQ